MEKSTSEIRGWPAFVAQLDACAISDLKSVGSTSSGLTTFFTGD